MNVVDEMKKKKHNAPFWRRDGGVEVLRISWRISGDRPCACLSSSVAAAVRPSLAELRSHRNAVFSREQSRQRALFPRTEKIEVSMQGPGLEGTLLVMNKGMSTRSAALDAFWRSCSTLLGQVLETAFKDDFSVELLQSVEVPVTSGAFCCDVVLDPQLDSWTASEETLRSLTRAALLLVHQDLPFEPLDVLPSVALELFSHSRCKQEEVEKLASENPSGTVQLYRCGDHVVLSGGPLVARTGLCSQLEVTAHSLGAGPGVSIAERRGWLCPHSCRLITSLEKLRKRAEKL
ncbi:hypothetical protein WMY93_034107, partial [Mugilogobius chulae]